MEIDLNNEPRQKVRLVVSYDGGPFSGFARNAGVRTVAGDLEAHLSRVLRHPVVVTGAGRTDKGVHAWGQVVSFETFADRLEPERLMRSLNHMGAPSLAVRSVDAVDADFDARFSARWRRYRYTILTSEAPNPFLAGTSWHLPQPLDLDAMRVAGETFLGTHDFSSFCRRPQQVEGRPPASLVRTVTGLEWTEHEGDLLRLEITAQAFCHQMVRSIVGTLVDIGRGHRAATDVAAMLAARDRAAAGDLAPPQGLCLWEVGY
ncbi:MAG: tRNA pseudouridine(38-40) synthase TruA [Acidimicrobiales bacterium]